MEKKGRGRRWTGGKKVRRKEASKATRHTSLGLGELKGGGRYALIIHAQSQGGKNTERACATNPVGKVRGSRERTGIEGCEGRVTVNKEYLPEVPYPFQPTTGIRK